MCPQIREIVSPAVAPSPILYAYGELQLHLLWSNILHRICFCFFDEGAIPEIAAHVKLLALRNVPAQEDLMTLTTQVKDPTALLVFITHLNCCLKICEPLPPFHTVSPQFGVLLSPAVATSHILDPYGELGPYLRARLRHCHIIPRHDPSIVL